MAILLFNSITAVVPQKGHSASPSPSTGHIERALPGSTRVGSIESIPTVIASKYDGFVLSLIHSARENSNEEGYEQAGLYVQLPDGTEEVFGNKDISSLSTLEQVHFNREKIDPVVATEGKILLCHTHPVPEAGSDIEHKHYVAPPSLPDVEMVIIDISRYASASHARTSNEYKSTFEEFAQRYESCVATPGDGYWKMHIANTDTALAWIADKPERDVVRDKAQLEVIKPLYDAKFFDAHDPTGEYKRFADSGDLFSIAAIIDRDKRYAFEAPEIIGFDESTRRLQEFLPREGFLQSFEERYQDYMLKFHSELSGEGADGFNKAYSDIFERPDYNATEAEYELIRAQILKRYGIDMEWVPAPTE